MSSPVWSKANDVLSSQLSFENEQDKLFLKGNSVQVSGSLTRMNLFCDGFETN